MKANSYLDDNVIVQRTFEFSLDVIDFTDQLNIMKKFALQNQLFKSGTSIGAQVREAQNAESRADFIHKFKIAAKEAEETKYWLLLCLYSKNLSNPNELLGKLEIIQKIINKIISTSKQKR